MQEIFANGRIVELILLLMVAEAAAPARRNRRKSPARSAIKAPTNRCSASAC